MAEATTEVLVVPDFSGFVGALRRGIDDAVRQVSGAGGAVLAPLSVQAAQIGKQIGAQLSAGVGQGVRDGAQAGANAMVQPLAVGGAAGGRAAGSQFANQFVPQSQGAIRKVTGFLTTAFAGAALTATGLLGKSLTMGFQRATLIEDSKSAMNIILGSVEEADKLMAGVLETVTGTPFNLDQFADAAKTLVAFNIEADKVPSILDAIGTAAAASGRGAEGVGSLVNTFGQMAATGRVSLEDVWSISASGINALAILANHFGLTANAMKDMISEGSVPAAESIDALMKGIMEGSDGAAGKVRGLGGSMEALRMTVSGAVGGFRAAMARAGANILGPALAESPDTINRLSKVLDAVSKRIGAVITAAANSEPFQEFLDSINGFLDRLASEDGKFLDELSDKLERIAPLAAGAGAALTAMGANGLPFIGQFLGQKINPLVAGIVAIATATPQGREALTNLAESLRPVIEDLIPKLAPLAEDLSKILSGVFTAGFEAAAVAVKAVVAVVEPLLPAITALTGFIADNEAVVWGLVAAYTAWALQAKLAAAANAAAMLSGSAGAAAAAGGAARVGLLTHLVGLAGRFKNAMSLAMAPGPIGANLKALPALLATIKSGFAAAASSAALMWSATIGAGVAIGVGGGSYLSGLVNDRTLKNLDRARKDLDLNYEIINDEEALLENRAKLVARYGELYDQTSNFTRPAAGAERLLGGLAERQLRIGTSANDIQAELSSVTNEVHETDKALGEIRRNSLRIGESLFKAMPEDFSSIEEATAAVKRFAAAKNLVLIGRWDSEGVKETTTTILSDFPKATQVAAALGIELQDAMDLEAVDPEILEESMKRIAGFVDGVRGMLQKEQSFLNILDEPVDPEQLADAMEAVREAEAGLASARGDDARSRAEDAESAAERAQAAADKIADAEDKIAAAQDKLDRARKANERSGSLQSAQDMAEAEREIAEAQRERAEASRSASESSARSADAATAATKRLQEARERLAQMQESDSPFNAEKIRAHFEGLLANTQEFQTNLQKAIQMGYHPTVIAEIMTAGPEEAGARLRELVGEHGDEIMEMVNAYYTALEGMNVKILEQARIFAMATDPTTGSAEKTKWAAKASQVSSTLLDIEARGEIVSPQQLAYYSGISESDLDTISKLFFEGDGSGGIRERLGEAPPVDMTGAWWMGNLDDWAKDDSWSAVEEALGPDLSSRWPFNGVPVEVPVPDTTAAEAEIAAMGARFAEIAESFGIEVDVDADTAPADDAIDVLLNPPVPPRATVTVDMIPDWARLWAEARAMEIVAKLTPSWLPNFGARWGGVTAYAGGGIEAHVAGRQVIRYAEPETGGEAFIPRFGNQARSEEIARIAAGWLGGKFITAKELSKITGFAAGGVLLSDPGIAAARPGAVMASIAGSPPSAPTAARGDGGIHIGQLVVKSGGARGAISMLRQTKKRRWLDDEEFDW